MKISVSPYELKPLQPQLNSQVFQPVRAGALIKVEYENLLGYADFHNQEILDYSKFDLRRYFERLLKGEVSSKQWDQTLSLSEQMALKKTVKAQNVKSHFLIQDIKNFSPLDLLRAETYGFDLFKVKMGKSLRAETDALVRIAKKADHKVKFRLDFNLALSKEEFVIWLGKEQNYLLKKIDFIEDPFPFNPNMWRHIENKYSVSLALDQAADPMVVANDELPEVVVVKPAIQDTFQILEKLKGSKAKITITHYMDHPVGQLGAIFTHMLMNDLGSGQLLPGGLSGFDLFGGESFPTDVLAQSSVLDSSIFNSNSWMFQSYFEELSWLPIN